MASNRIGRINEEIQRELAALLRTVKDPRVHGLVSITHVDTTRRLCLQLLAGRHCGRSSEAKI